MSRLRDRATHLFVAVTEPAPLADWTRPSRRAAEADEPRAVTPARILAAVLIAVIFTVLAGIASGWRA